MRFISLVLALSLLAAAAASARHIPHPSESSKRNSAKTCEHYYWSCKAHHPDNLAGCEILWNAVRKSGEVGAVWKTAEASEAADIRGRPRPCLN